jgi:prolyl-tRNA editing enzyme YbaK/EbsC (Cys-tRNA(Pro) deacylase)
MSAEDSGSPTSLAPSAQRVADELAKRGSAARVIELPDSARTAADAARAVGCTVDQIAKSLVFRAAPSGRHVLVIASGGNRVDVDAVGASLGEPLVRAEAEWVREVTGFTIGGIPPVGHRTAPVVYIDEDLLAFDTVWAAGGTPNAVFRVEPAELVSLTGGTVLRLAERS